MSRPLLPVYVLDGHNICFFWAFLNLRFAVLAFSFHREKKICSFLSAGDFSLKPAGKLSIDSQRFVSGAYLSTVFCHSPLYNNQSEHASRSIGAAAGR